MKAIRLLCLFLLLMFVAAGGQETQTKSLHQAAADGDIDQVKLLISTGNDVNAKENGGGQTPLHRAAEKGHTTVSELLIANGADINAKDLQARTALQLAKDKGYAEIAKLLRRHGAKE